MEDIESDLSAFHRVDNYLELPGPRFFSLALRLGAYTGAVQARLIKMQQDEDGGPSAHRPRVGGSAPQEKVMVSDDVMLARLANEGWGEHVIEKG